MSLWCQEASGSVDIFCHDQKYSHRHCLYRSEYALLRLNLHATMSYYCGGFSGSRGPQTPGNPLPLTDPRDAEAQRMLNIPYRIIW